MLTKKEVIRLTARNKEVKMKVTESTISISLPQSYYMSVFYGVLIFSNKTKHWYKKPIIIALGHFWY